MGRKGSAPLPLHDTPKADNVVLDGVLVAAGRDPAWLHRKIQEHGPALLGSSFGDFGVHELTLNRGFLVSSHYPSLFTYVSPKQVPVPTTPTMATGLYGREMRQMDSQQQEIIYVAKLDRELAN